MRIMTLNSGSSSVKYSVWDMPARKMLCSGIVDRVTVGGSFIRHQDLTGQEILRYQECPDHGTAIELIINLLASPEDGVIRDLSEITAVGHRVVHGGEVFTQSVRITDEVIKTIEECSVLAPLHNPPNLIGIRVAMNLMPDICHVAIFDTTFFTTMPLFASVYALPYEWYEEDRIRRYGFHGTSHLYVSRRATVLLKKRPSEVNVITLHIGNGVSITAVKRGIAYDHSMGFTPLEGAVMGTRCGDIDPAIPLYVMKKKNLTCEQMEYLLNKRSGLLGITGKYIDRRDIIAAMIENNQRARLAIDIECHRLLKYIGAYAVAMNGVDAIVFTGGVGENSDLHRAKVCENLGFIGVKIDPEMNKRAVGGKKEIEISSSDSEVKVFVIPTNEELVFAEDVLAILENKYDNYTKFEYSFQKEDSVPF